MGKEERVANYALKIAEIVSELRCLSEMITEKEVVHKILTSTPNRFDSLTLTMKQFGDMNTVRVDLVNYLF